MLKNMIRGCLMCASMAVSASAQQVYKDSEVEAFLQAGGITPREIGMRWYRECRIYGAATQSDIANAVSKWELSSEARSKQLTREAIKRNQANSAWQWSAQCRPQLYFPESADQRALLPIELVKYRPFPGGPILTMSEGNSLRYHACQSVQVYGNMVARKPSCDK